MASQEGQTGDPRVLGAEALEGLLARLGTDPDAGGRRVQPASRAARGLLREPRLARARARRRRDARPPRAEAPRGPRDPGRARLRPRPRPQRAARSVAPRATRGRRARVPARAAAAPGPRRGLLWDSFDRCLAQLDPERSRAARRLLLRGAQLEPGLQGGARGQPGPLAQRAADPRLPRPRGAPREPRAMPRREGTFGEREIGRPERPLPFGERGSRLEAIPARPDERGGGGRGRAGVPRVRRRPRGPPGPGGRAHRGVPRGRARARRTRAVRAALPGLACAARAPRLPARAAGTARRRERCASCPPAQRARGGAPPRRSRSWRPRASSGCEPSPPG